MNKMAPSTETGNKPPAIYVWLVPSEHMLDQPGSWRIRKWDTAPFPEATHKLSAGDSYVASPEAKDAARYRWLRLIRPEVRPNLYMEALDEHIDRISNGEQRG